MPHPNENCLQQRVVRSRDIKTFCDTWNYINYGGKLPHYNSILRNHFDLPISSNLGSTPHPVPVITRIITCLVGNPQNPALATLSSHYFQVSSLRHPTSLEIWLSCFLARNAKTSSRRALVLVQGKAEHGETFWRLFVYLCILNLMLFFQNTAFNLGAVVFVSLLHTRYFFLLFCSKANPSSNRYSCLFQSNGLACNSACSCSDNISKQ